MNVQVHSVFRHLSNQILKGPASMKKPKPQEFLGYGLKISAYNGNLH